MDIPKKKINFVKVLIAVIAILLIYSIIPRVPAKKSPYGREISTADFLSVQIKEDLKRFIKYEARRMQTVVAIHKGEIIFEEGDIKELVNCHSARKSIMSLLMGIAQDKGLLRLDESLEELGIDESQIPLTAQEKSATIRDLLMSRSGIYLQAEGEHDWQERRRPKRGQHKPGEYFFYNNFDFNALGTILEQKSGKSMGAFMEEHLAKPIGMLDFHPKNVVYGNPWFLRKDESDHRIFWIYLSARDFAKIGVLVAQNGKWENKQVVSSEWLEESLEPYSDLSNFGDMFNPYEAHAYSWWIDNDNNTIWADGYGGQFLMIDPVNNLVVVQRNFTGNSLLTSGLSLMDKTGITTSKVI